MYFTKQKTSALTLTHGAKLDLYFNNKKNMFYFNLV